jgi:hypothetical protein
MRRTREGKWDSRYKGADQLNAEEARRNGCISAAIVAGAVLWLAMRGCGSDTSESKSFASAMVVNQTVPTSNATEQSSTSPARSNQQSLCGVAAARPTDVDESAWHRYSCKSADEFDGDWTRCLMRPAYAQIPGQGCAAAKRCCPPND